MVDNRILKQRTITAGKLQAGDIASIKDRIVAVTKVTVRGGKVSISYVYGGGTRGSDVLPKDTEIELLPMSH